MLGRIKALMRSMTAEAPENRIARAAAELDIALDRPCPVAEAEARLEADIRELTRAANIPALAKLHDDTFASKVTLTGGRHGYAVIENGIWTTIDAAETPPQVAELMLPLFETAWNAAGRSPFASAVYAVQMFIVGYGFRGTGWASDVSNKGWEKLLSCSERSLDIMLEAADDADSCPYWHRAMLFMGLSNGTPSQHLHTLFENARSFDRYDINVHTARAYQLLPRWHGTYEQLEVFARQGYATTCDRMGAEMYARIYQSLKSMESLPETACDWHLLQDGFEDWLARHETQSIVNAYASAAMAFGDGDAARNIVRSRLSSLYPEAWDSPEQIASALEASLR